MAREHCAGDRRPGRVAAEAEDHLQRPFVASAMVANGGQCVVCPGPGAPGHIRQQQAGRLRLVPLRTEPIRSPGLGPGQPITVFRERLRITRVSSQHVTGGVCQRQTPGREARAVSAPPCHHVPQRQFPCSCRPQRRCAPQASSDVIDRPHRTTRRPVRPGDRVLDGPQVRQRSLGSSGKPQRFALRLGTRTHMGTRRLESLPVGTLRRAQPMPRLRCATTGAVRGVERHSGYKNNIFLEYNQGKTAI
jgi:hypothetical protein